MRQKISGLLCLILSTMFFSCSTDDTGSSPSLNRTVTASIDGQTWMSISGGAVANLQTVDFNGEDITMLQIVGAKLDQSSISMQFPVENLGVGTYTFDSNSSASLNYTTPNAADVYTSLEATGDFTVNVTSVDLNAGTISGTFSGTVLNDVGDSIEITNGTFTAVSFISSQFYSNGTMRLSKNDAPVFIMDYSAADGKFLTILQTTAGNSITLFGHNTTATADAGLYVLTFPDDVMPGTYDLTSTTGFDAGIGTSEGEPEFTLTSGSMTITSHAGNLVTGSFNYIATNGSETIEITDGTFSITHN